MNENILTPGAYTLPNDCKAFVRNGKVIVSCKCGAADIPRCRDCKHCIRAQKQYNQWYASPVCKMQPKANRGYNNPEIKRQQRYYAVRPSDAACDKYEPITTESK